MQGSGTNHNMNHIVKRIETRVLAPPGGFSSLCFGGGNGPDVQRQHNYNPKAAAREKATRVLLAAYEDQERAEGDRGGMRDSLDALVRHPSPGQSSGTKRGRGGDSQRIPGLEEHYGGREQPSPQQAVARFRAEKYQEQAPSRAQHKVYADALQQQIHQKQQLDSRDPYAGRKALREAPCRLQDDPHQPAPYMSSARDSGGRGGHSSYAQQLQDQINEKKLLTGARDEAGDGYHIDYNPRRGAHCRRAHSPGPDSSTSTLSRIGHAQLSQQSDKGAEAKKYAQQLQNQIATKQHLAEHLASPGNKRGGGGSVYTDKLGNPVGNRLAANKRRTRVAESSLDPYESFLG